MPLLAKVGRGCFIRFQSPLGSMPCRGRSARWQMSATLTTDADRSTCSGRSPEAFDFLIRGGNLHCKQRTSLIVLINRGGFASFIANKEVRRQMSGNNSRKSKVFKPDGATQASKISHGQAANKGWGGRRPGAGRPRGSTKLLANAAVLGRISHHNGGLAAV
jgi:hypothetical protein